MRIVSNFMMAWAVLGIAYPSKRNRKIRYRTEAAVRRIAYPNFDCQLCVGQHSWQGCYCAYHGAVAPAGENDQPRWYHLFARWILKVTGRGKEFE